MPPRGRSSTEKPKNLKKSAGKLLQSLKPWRVALIIACIFSIVSTVLTIFGPKILGNMTTDAVTSLSLNGAIDWAPIARSAITLLILYGISSVMSYFEDFILGYIAAKFTKKLRTQILEKISRLPISYFDKHQFGDVLSRMTNDVDVLAQSLRNTLSEIISDTTTIIGILIMILTISWQLSLIAVVTVPLSFLLVSRVAGKAQKYFKKQQDTLGSLNGIIEESYAGQLIIKTNSHEPTSLKEFNQLNRSLYETSWKAQFFSSMAFPITHICTNLGYVAICILGGYQAIEGLITIGNVQAFIQYVNQFNRPITSVAQIASTIQLSLAASERIFNFLEEPEESTSESLRKITNGVWDQGEKVRGAVEFHDVNFSYLPDEPTITNFSCRVKPGMQVALVGPTGAGKTTIVNLLMRFYEPATGYISVDGVPVTELSRADERGMFGMVLQDTWLFSGTIEENLRYGRKGATHEEVVAACKKAHVHHFIESLPQGYSTRISEDSDNISAGEKQLLTIARALIANPPMMILDEATSNVDTRTEQLIQDAFSKLTKGRTSFVIAHRLSTIRDADLILVMREGNIVEQGTHTELLAGSGFYAELYNSQFAEG